MSQENAKFRPWVTLAAALGMNLLLGLNYSWSVIKKALVTDWHWTHVDASLPYTMYTALFSLSSVVGGKMQDKYGPRLVASIGGILLGGGVITCSIAAGPLAMMAGYGIAGAGAGLCLATSIPTCVKCCPPDKRGLFTGIVMGGSGLAPAYFSPLADWLLAHYGIPSTFFIMGAGILSGMLLMAQFLRVPATGAQTAAAPAAATGPGQTDFTWRDILRLPAFYRLWLAYFFMSSGGLMIIGHIATIAITQADWDEGFYLVILLAVFNTGGRISGGFLSDRFGRVPTMRAVFLIVAANMLLFAHYTTPLLLSFGAALTGICYGAGASLIALITAEFFGLKNLGANYGIILTSWGTAGVLGPLVAGRAVDVTGEYVIAYLVSAVLLFASFLLMSGLRPPSGRAPGK